jgi:RHS repeat-associated protein
MISYKHNALNQRVAKLVDGVTVEKYLWRDLTTLLAIYDANDNLLQRFEYAVPQGHFLASSQHQRMPVAMTSSGTKYYLHYDQIGSLRAVSDTNGQIVKEVVYDTFGTIVSDSDPTFKVPFGFAGGLYDPDTKLTRFGYRDYDSFIGKWTAKDSIGFDGGDSNLYGYVLGDPVNYVDPEGLLEKNIFDKAWDLFFGESASDMRKKAFCVTCKGLIDKGLSDTDACGIADQPISLCNADRGCYIDYSTWVAKGCTETCK